LLMISVLILILGLCTSEAVPAAYVPLF
jgi:hypothetical protein